MSLSRVTFVALCVPNASVDPMPLLAATAMPPEDEVTGGPNLAFLLLGAPGRISIPVSIAGFASPASTAICGVDLEKLLGLHCGQIPRVRKGGEGTSTNWTTTINYIFPSLLRWKTKERSFSFTIAEENIHRHGWTAQQSMVWYYIESCSLVFVFRMIPSTSSDGEARMFRLIGTSMQRSKAWSVELHRIMLACDSIRRRCTGV